MKEEQTTNGLPKNWKWVKLQEIVSLLGDGLHGTPPYSEDGDYYFINGNNLRDGKIIIKENTKKVCHKQFDKYKKDLTDKTILVSINGTIGNVAFYKNEKVILGKSACYFNVKEHVNKYYIALLLNGEKFLRYANNSATGSTIKNVSLKAMREFELPLPPKATQQQIVSKIEELFSELDKGIEELKTAQQQLKVYRQAVLKWAFEGKLTNADVKDGELPGGWKWVTIDNIGKVKGGKRLPPKHSYSLEQTDFIYIMAGNLKYGTVKHTPTYIKRETYEALSNYKVDGGEVYITIVGACIGDAGIIPKTIGKAILTENAAKIIELKNVYGVYLAKWLNSHSCQVEIKSKILSATLGKLALSRISVLRVPLPPLEEQQQIVQEIESRLSVCDNIEKTITASLKQAEALRQSILKEAFEGKLMI